MTAGGDDTKRRNLRFRMLQESRLKMRLQVIDAHKRQVTSVGEGLSRVQSDQQ